MCSAMRRANEWPLMISVAFLFPLQAFGVKA